MRKGCIVEDDDGRFAGASPRVRDIKHPGGRRRARCSALEAPAHRGCSSRGRGRGQCDTRLPNLDPTRESDGPLRGSPRRARKYTLLDRAADSPPSGRHHPVGRQGREGALPWRHPEDLARLDALTAGAPCILGRLTHEAWKSVDRHGRKPIVISALGLPLRAPVLRVTFTLGHRISRTTARGNLRQRGTPASRRSRSASRPAASPPTPHSG
ncbi:MAG: dihydrofolate reductase [Verrucomicrobia bacterium]|nr:dihydrofolate reductase [Verrucomicrobiota bacterium]